MTAKAPGGPVALGPRGRLLGRGIGGQADDEEVGLAAVPAAARANDEGLEGLVGVLKLHTPRVSPTRDRGGQSS